MTALELDELYTQLCHAIDAAGAGQGEAYLARLVLLLIDEISTPARISTAIAAARLGGG